MIHNAVFPYPDELLASALIRLCRRYRLSPHTLGKHVLHLPSWRLSFMGALPLPPICQVLGMSAEQLARLHTPLPYASAFTASQTYRTCWNAAVTGTESAPLRALMSNAAGAPGLRKFCTACVREDIATHGESFWHLSHQLPGVLACTRHGQALQQTRLCFNLTGTKHLTLPSECRGTRIRLRPSPLITVAIESVELLQRRAPEPRSQNFYRQLAEERGFLSPDRQVSEVALSHLMARRFSAAFLRTHGLLDARGQSSWAALMFRPHVDFGYAPIKHVLLEAALSIAHHSALGSLNHRSSGPPASDDHAVDAHYSRAAKGVLDQALREERVLTTEQFLRISGCYGAYRHRKDRMPKLRQLVLAFRSSAASVKPLGQGKTLFRSRPQEKVVRGRAISQ